MSLKLTSSPLVKEPALSEDEGESREGFGADMKKSLSPLILSLSKDSSLLRGKD
jgi:hypothetical protein